MEKEKNVRGVLKSNLNPEKIQKQSEYLEELITQCTEGDFSAADYESGALWVYDIMKRDFSSGLFLGALSSAAVFTLACFTYLLLK